MHRRLQYSPPMLARIQPHAIVIGEQAEAGEARPLSFAVGHARHAARHSSWMMARLALEAGPQHRANEDALVSSLVEPSLGAYRHFLARMYGFSAPLGVALLATEGLEAELLVTRVRTGWLASDLLGLDLTRTEATMLQRRLEIPRFASAAEALGWLYVSERITLRHELLRTRLLAVIPTVFAAACDYLMSTNGRVHMQWNELGRALDRAAPSEEVAAAIVAGARAALDVQQRWIDATVYDGF